MEATGFSAVSHDTARLRNTAEAYLRFAIASENGCLVAAQCEIFMQSCHSEAQPYRARNLLFCKRKQIPRRQPGSE